jgi:hypothetical protein
MRITMAKRDIKTQSPIFIATKIIESIENEPYFDKSKLIPKVAALIRIHEIDLNIRRFKDIQSPSEVQRMSFDFYVKCEEVKLLLSVIREEFPNDKVDSILRSLDAIRTQAKEVDNV